MLTFTYTAFAGSVANLVAAAKKEGQLNVIALPRDWCGYGLVIDGFKAEYGLEVNELHPGAGSSAEIEAIKANNGSNGPGAPDVIDVGLSFDPSAKKDGLLQPYKVSTWDTISEGLKDPEGYWYGGYYGVLALEVNADIVKKIPADWSDLLASDYKSSVALAGNPKVSNQAIHGVFAAGLSAANGSIDQSADQGLKFFAALNKRGNFVPIVADGGWLAEGITPVIIRWDYLALGDRDRLKGKAKVEVVVPKTGVVGGVYVQAISAYAPHPNAARLWMEWLYSDRVQLTWLKGYCHPIRLKDLTDSNKVPVALREQLPPAEHYEWALFPTLEEQEKAKETITKGWDSIVGVRVNCYVAPPVPTR